MHGHIQDYSVLCLLTILQVCMVHGSIEWKTVLLATKSSGVNVKADLFDKWGQSINRDSTTKEEDSVFDIAKNETFRSPLIDSWLVENHTYVRLGVFSSRGDLLWWVTFSGFLSDLTNWNRQTRIEMASHSTLTEDTFETTMNFNDDAINVTTADKGWLWVFQKDGQTKMFFSMWEANAYPGIDYVQESNKVVLNKVKSTPWNTFSFSLGYTSFWMGFSSITHIIGFGIERDDSGAIMEFMLSYNANESCFGQTQSEDWMYYKNSSGLPMIIKPTYNSGKFYLDSDEMVTIFAKCLKVKVISTTGSDTARANLFIYSAQGEYLEGDILAIQWGNDPAIDDPLQNALDKIYADLSYDKYNTARYKNRFTSAKDSRPSAFVFGVLGLVIFLIIIASIILLDVATLRSQLKYAKRNTVGFRRKVKEKWKSLRRRTSTSLAKLRAKRDGSGKPNMENMSKTNDKNTNVSNSQKKQVKITKTKVSPKNERKSGSTVSYKRGSNVSIAGSSSSQQNQPSTSKQTSRNTVTKKQPAVLTRISE